MKDDKKLNDAEQVIINHMRRWPTLYTSAHSFYLGVILGACGSPEWKDGKIALTEKKFIPNGKKYRKTEYPFQVSEEYAISIFNRNNSSSLSVNYSSYAPIHKIPDDAHEDWLSFIGFHLFLDLKITPAFYDIILQANCIRNYGVISNPNSSETHYRYEWKRYFEKIPSFLARIQLIHEMRRQGEIPADRYMGIDI